ncbi:aspartate beta-hydroxylase domain-containing protein 2-like [Lytechinus variegatus]|uniref:aspartate beta-hydroxylase domain-containing protein 2-like n=1 Tax=Lytechinus variegatus TaxID=7654 RepID=UPI001BB28120|nr:aspartate beta-hydroxylase domain-containing protein 2-like [Lytechinus variegatus]
MDLKEEEGDSTWEFYSQHVLTTIAGLVMLLYILIKGRKAETSEQDAKKADEVSKPDVLGDYAQCHQPDCIRCKPRKDNHLLWNERLGKFLEKQCPENQLFLKDLWESFQQDAQGGCIDGISDKADIEEKTIKLQNPVVYSYPALQSCPWYDIEAVSSKGHRSDIQILKDKFGVIKQEFESVYARYLEGDCSGWSENNVPSGSWNVFHLYNQGRRIEDNCLKCARTVEVLEGLETFMWGVSFGYACFSVLQPGSHISPHFGPCNIRLRCHLGIQIPVNCSLTVAGECKQWKEEDCLLFDDSYLHEAVNANEGSVNSIDGSRVILMVDLWHPDLSDLEKEAFREVFC